MSAGAGGTSKSGIQKLSNGESIIPSSTRADGSVRKEIRVKPGYRPPEDVEVYKNRTAEAFNNRGKGGVPGAEKVTATDTSTSGAANKNAKRREARKRAAAAAGDADVATDENSNHKSKEQVDAQPVVAEDPEAEKAKEARKLAKKLRQARELSEKKEKGEGMLPEQILKITRISELIRQLENLGFDQDGEKKTSDTATVEKDTTTLGG